MSAPDAQVPNFALSLYPADQETYIKTSKGSSLAIREVQIAIMIMLEKICVKDIDAIKTKMEGIAFETPAQEQEFYDQIQKLIKMNVITDFAVVYEDDMRAAAEEALSKLSSDSAHKRLAAQLPDKKQVDVISLGLHLLYNARVLVPIGTNRVAFGVNFNKDLYGRFSSQIEAVAKNAGNQALVPYILYGEWQADSLLALSATIPTLEKKIEEQQKTIDQLNSDVAAFKAQSTGSSQFSWEV